MNKETEVKQIIERIVTEDVVKRVSEELLKLENTNEEFASIFNCGSSDVLNEGSITAAFMIAKLVDELK